jgi:Kef-type K+ transport system membrane component KefB
VTDHLLIFWIQLLVLLSAAHALGALARRAGQPPVVGALAAGLLLSPSVLGAISPDAYAWLFPADPRQQGLLHGVAWIGVALLVLITGFETDLALVRRLGRAAALVAVFAQVIPFVTGFGVGMALPAELLGDQATRVLFALFIATALSISALPVIARILVELDLMRRNFG